MVSCCTTLVEVRWHLTVVLVNGLVLELVALLYLKVRLGNTASAMRKASLQATSGRISKASAGVKIRPPLRAKSLETRPKLSSAHTCSTAEAFADRV